MNKNKAFTLIELLIVIGIIGALIAVTLGFLKNAQDKGKDAGKIQSIAETRKALQLYATDNGGFPSDKKDLITENYIQILNSSIIYAGIDTKGNICSLSQKTCSSYHLAIPLNDPTNKALNSDSNTITTGIIDGKTSNCKPDGGGPNLCYDVTP